MLLGDIPSFPPPYETEAEYLSFHTLSQIAKFKGRVRGQKHSPFHILSHVRKGGGEGGAKVLTISYFFVIS